MLRTRATRLIYNMRASRAVFQDFWQGNVVFGLFFDCLGLGLGPFGGTNWVLFMGLIAGRRTRRVWVWGIPHGVVKLVSIDRMVPLTFNIVIWVTIKLTTLI